MTKVTFVTLFDITCYCTLFSCDESLSDEITSKLDNLFFFI